MAETIRFSEAVVALYDALVEKFNENEVISDDIPTREELKGYERLCKGRLNGDPTILEESPVSALELARLRMNPTQCIASTMHAHHDLVMAIVRKSLKDSYDEAKGAHGEKVWSTSDFRLAYLEASELYDAEISNVEKMTSDEMSIQQFCNDVIRKYDSTFSCSGY